MVATIEHRKRHIAQHAFARVVIRHPDGRLLFVVVLRHQIGPFVRRMSRFLRVNSSSIPLSVGEKEEITTAADTSNSHITSIIDIIHDARSAIDSANLMRVFKLSGMKARTTNEIRTR